MVGSTLGASGQVWNKVRPRVGFNTSCVALCTPFLHNTHTELKLPHTSVNTDSVGGGWSLPGSDCPSSSTGTEHRPSLCQASVASSTLTPCAGQHHKVLGRQKTFSSLSTVKGSKAICSLNSPACTLIPGFPRGTSPSTDTAERRDPIQAC